LVDSRYFSEPNRVSSGHDNRQEVGNKERQQESSRQEDCSQENACEEEQSDEPLLARLRTNPRLYTWRKRELQTEAWSQESRNQESGSKSRRS